MILLTVCMNKHYFPPPIYTKAAIEDISVETQSQQGDVIGQFCIHKMEVEALAERVSELCM